MHMTHRPIPPARRLLWALGAILMLTAVAYGAGMTPAAAPPTGPRFTCAAQTVAGRQQGRLLWGHKEVLVIMAKAAGLTGYERASIVAQRLNQALQAGVTPAQVSVVKVADMLALQAGRTVLLTVTSDEAAAHHLTPAALAAAWAQAIRQALTPPPPPPSPKPVAPPVPPAPETPAMAPPPMPVTPAATPPTVPYADQVVPLLGADGTKFGVAQVSGPSAAVAQVKAVVLLTAGYEQTWPVALYVPLSTDAPSAPLARVPGVGITAIPPPPPGAPAAHATGSFADAVRIFGPDWMLLHYAGRLDKAINAELAQAQAPLGAPSKVVPILSSGQNSAVGAAQLTGPQAQLDLVHAVQVGDLVLPGNLLGQAFWPVTADRDLQPTTVAVLGVYVSAVVGFSK
jgi:hypothetical protein